MTETLILNMNKIEINVILNLTDFIKNQNFKFL